MWSVPESRIPETLGEALGTDAPCRIPATHDRLLECHYWWHEMGRNYHEPQQFRWALGAFLQAARSVTFMLQAERATFADLSFYDQWCSAEENRPLLKWINEARVETVHKNPLLPRSWIRLTCLDAAGHPILDVADLLDEDDDKRIGFSPFVCSHRLMAMTDGMERPGQEHGHLVERHWEMDSMPGRELLDLCADAYALLDQVVGEAHRAVGQGFAPALNGELVERPSGRLPCMIDPARHRIAKFVPGPNGKSRWVDEPPALHVT